MPRLRVVVVDDSAVARHLIVEVLKRDPELEVVGQADSGPAAVALIETLHPDVITMDIHMPVMDGYKTTRTIMERVPTPIVIVSGDFDRNDVARSFKALEAGALTVLPKPRGLSGEDFQTRSAELVDTVKLMAGVKVFKRHSRRRLGHGGVAPAATRPRPPSERTAYGTTFEVVAVAASTGGPAALATLLGSLPAGLPVPVLIVQHLAKGFDEGLARWLDDSCSLSVRLARGGDRPVPGEVLIAPQGTHMGVTSRSRIALTEEPPLKGHRPSASVLFASVAREYGKRAIGVILTGMGEDGVAGLADLSAAGGQIIAQDESSCVVYGMPRAAVAAGVADLVIPIGDIGPAVVNAVGTPNVA